MVKKILIGLGIILLIVLFGTWPISVFSKIFEWIGIALKWIANILDFFNWNGLV